MSLFSKLGDINEMKKQASAMQAMLAQEQVTATNNGVTITMNGNQEILAVNIARLKLVLIHKPELTRQAIEENNPDYVLFGHTHKPGLEEYFNMGKRVWLLNPGTLGGIFYRATFAVITDGVAELKILELL